MHRAVAAALILSLGPLPAVAQLGPGMRIRIHSTAFEGPVIGTLVAISADTLVVLATGGTQQISARTIQRVDVSQGMGHAGGHGAALGAPIGALAGALWGWLAHQQCEAQSNCFVVNDPFPEIAVGALFGAGAGAGLGYLIGMTNRGERWRQAALLIAVTPTRLQLSVRF